MAARELRVIWGVVGVTAVVTAVTYARLPADDLYNVSGSGLASGLGRALVALNFPGALIALGVLGVIAQFFEGRTRIASLVAGVCCAIVVVPGVVTQRDLDAKWVNAVPAVGVAIALALSFVAVVPATRRRRGDVVRWGLVVALTFVALPWIAAALGFYVHASPIFQTDAIVSYHGNAPHPAVHHGLHHGLFGLMLVITALLLSRIPNRVGLFLALMLAYGIANIANDVWLEQVAERGWTSWTIPSSTEPALTWTWLGVLLATPLIWLAWFRERATTPLPADGLLRQFET